MIPQEISESYQNIRSSYQHRQNSSKLPELQQVQKSPLCQFFCDSSLINLKKLEPDHHRNLILSQVQVSSSEQFLKFDRLPEYKWSCLSESIHHGRFSIEEQRILSMAVGEFLATHEITYNEFEIILNEKNVINTLLKKLGFFKILAGLLPHRSTASCYRFLKRSFNNRNRKGRWTESEERQLIDLVKEHGRNWVEIGKVLGRTSDNVYDKYRSIGGENAERRKKQFWTLRELIRLLTQVQLKTSPFLKPTIKSLLQDEKSHDVREKMSWQSRRYNTLNHLSHNNQLVVEHIGSCIKKIDLEKIAWSAVSKKVKSRSLIDCKNKFLQVMGILLKSDGKQERQIINFIAERRSEEVDWRQWDQEKNGFHLNQAKNRLNFMIRSVADRNQKKFTDIIVDLKMKYARKDTN